MFACIRYVAYISEKHLPVKDVQCRGLQLLLPRAALTVLEDDGGNDCESAKLKEVMSLRA